MSQVQIPNRWHDSFRLLTMLKLWLISMRMRMRKMMAHVQVVVETAAVKRVDAASSEKKVNWRVRIWAFPISISGTTRT